MNFVHADFASGFGLRVRPFSPRLLTAVPPPPFRRIISQPLAGRKSPASRQPPRCRSCRRRAAAAAGPLVCAARSLPSSSRTTELRRGISLAQTRSPLAHYTQRAL